MISGTFLLFLAGSGGFAAAGQKSFSFGGL
jgi:hypothetical protein